MSAFPQTWYRPNRYGRELIEEITVLGETKEFITVPCNWGKKRTRRQAKDGATPSKSEALQALLDKALREEQRGNDLRSRAIEMQKRIRAAIQESSP